MSIDLEKLTPAPWAVHDCARPDHTVCMDCDDNTCVPLFERWDGNPDTTDAAFIALARNAFDVMMRRGWTVHRNDQPSSDGNRWYAQNDLEEGIEPAATPMWPDPFTALVEADKWYKVQGKRGTCW